MASTESPPATTSSSRCPVAPEARGFAEDLPNARAALREGKTLTIVALGSSSTSGAGASSPESTYPAVMRAELARLLPGHDVQVINRGVGGDSVMQMYHRMTDDVTDHEPTVVIWQTGVNDAITDIGVDRFRRIMRKGIAYLRAADIDVIMMDQQPIPRVERYPLYGEYVSALREVAAETATPVYRRFDVMRALVADGRLSEKDLFAADALHMADASYFCVGVTLARTIAEKLSPRAAGVRR